jgi:hypothetical protein
MTFSEPALRPHSLSILKDASRGPRLIYRLVRINKSWTAELGIRTTEGVARNSILTQEAFDFKKDAEAWILGQAKALNVAFLPKAVDPARTYAVIGGVIPEMRGSF